MNPGPWLSCIKPESSEFKYTTHNTDIILFQEAAGDLIDTNRVGNSMIALKEINVAMAVGPKLVCKSLFKMIQPRILPR